MWNLAPFVSHPCSSSFRLKDNRGGWGFTVGKGWRFFRCRNGGFGIACFVSESNVGLGMSQ
jgi:hypothetical protein